MNKPRHHLQILFSLCLFIATTGPYAQAAIQESSMLDSIGNTTTSPKHTPLNDS